ncbi:hypothetical protein ONR57_01135 [Hoyosella sp. YIM 151337]|uniref:hypothetical protein n=1 Tax=Hoyosella sp. YIM 151337 TaxID=2992742 RepID=UPI002235CAA6|nr:hypothetical protein [Hoyosella sp. YIM 151337]MCW4351903.1 hypothetical protein [Hoyosella sp. YIM 151337]
MTTAVVLTNRFISAFAGILLAGAALLALGNQAGWMWARNVLATVDTTALLGATDETWWPRAVFGVSVAALLAGAVIVAFVFWPDRIGPVDLDPDSSGGHLTIDLRALASAAVRDLHGRLPSAIDVHAHPFLDRGVPTIRLTVVLPGTADLHRAADAVAASVDDIVFALDAAPIAVPVFFEISRPGSKVRTSGSQ